VRKLFLAISTTILISGHRTRVIADGFFWSYTLMQIPMGMLAARLNLRWLYAAAFTLWSVAQGLVDISTGLTSLIALRILLGVEGVFKRIVTFACLTGLLLIPAARVSSPVAAVALIIGGCRGYIQAWCGHDHRIPERSAQRVFKISDQILKAGLQTAEMAA
jgi:hypothetical protein